MTLSYVLKEDGYDILKDGATWISQYEPYIPYPNMSYEENAKLHINDLSTQTPSIDEIEELKNTISIQKAGILDMAQKLSTEYQNRVMLEEAVVELASLIGGGVK